MARLIGSMGAAYARAQRRRGRDAENPDRVARTGRRRRANVAARALFALAGLAGFIRRAQVFSPRSFWGGRLTFTVKRCA